MPFVFLVRPLVIGIRKSLAKKKGKEYKPLFPKAIKKVQQIKYKLKNKKNGESI